MLCWFSKVKKKTTTQKTKDKKGRASQPAGLNSSIQSGSNNNVPIKNVRINQYLDNSHKLKVKVGSFYKSIQIATTGKINQSDIYLNDYNYVNIASYSPCAQYDNQ